MDAQQPTRELDTSLRNRARRDIALYGLARVLLFVALTVIIQSIAILIDAPVPLIMSALLALMVAFPLSMLVFKKLRLRVTEELALWGQERKAHKQWVQAQLADRD